MLHIYLARLGLRSCSWRKPLPFSSCAWGGTLPLIILPGLIGDMVISSIHQQQSWCSLLFLDPWLHGQTKDLTSQAHSWVSQGICKATAEPVCVLGCVHINTHLLYIVQLTLAGYFWLIHSLMAKDPTETVRNIKFHIRTNIQFIYFKAQVYSHVRADVASNRVLKWKNICVKPEIN